MDQQQVVLTQYLRRGENMGCADCDTRTPRWASLSFGNFICIRCADNEIANDYWEYKMPEGRKPNCQTGNYQLEQFIRDKYVRKLWIPKGAIDPVTEFYHNGGKPPKVAPKLERKLSSTPDLVPAKKNRANPQGTHVIKKKIAEQPGFDVDFGKYKNMNEGKPSSAEEKGKKGKEVEHKKREEAPKPLLSFVEEEEKKGPKLLLKFDDKEEEDGFGGFQEANGGGNPNPLTQIYNVGMSPPMPQGGMPPKYQGSNIWGNMNMNNMNMNMNMYGGVNNNSNSNSNSNRNKSITPNINLSPPTYPKTKCPQNLQTPLTENKIPPTKSTSSMNTGTVNNIYNFYNNVNLNITNNPLQNSRPRSAAIPHKSKSPNTFPNPLPSAPVKDNSVANTGELPKTNVQADTVKYGELEFNLDLRGGNKTDKEGKDKKFSGLLEGW